MRDLAIIHGCLVSIEGVGVLIVGDSGVGKTTICLELERLGHNFIADDAVLIRLINSELVGSAPPETTGLLANRGFKVVKRITMGLELSCSIDLIVELRSNREALPETQIDEMLSETPRIHLEVNGSAAKQIELFALRTFRGRN